MKPIPTIYNGTEYRSRLEARWALFFFELGIDAVYEAFEIENNGISYLPDFWVANLLYDRPVLVEIKPIAPNAHYIDYLNNIRKNNQLDIYILVGDPSFYQPKGVHIYGRDMSFIRNGFLFSICERCGYYEKTDLDDDFRYCMCEMNYCPPLNTDWNKVSEKAKYYRFDL